MRFKFRTSILPFFLNRAQCYKTFYICNLQIFVMSKTVCPRQACTAESNVCGPGQEPILEWSTKNVLYLGRPQLYPQTLDNAGKAYQGQTL